MSYNWEIILVKNPMKFLGLWPDNRLSSDFQFIVSIVFAFIALAPTFSFVFFIKSDSDTMDVITYFGTFFIGMVELLVFKFKKNEIIQVFQVIKNNWDVVEKYPKYRLIMKNYGNISRKIIPWVYLMMLLSYIGYIGHPIVTALIEHSTLRKFGNKVWFPFDTESKPNFEITIFFYSISVFYSGVTLVCIDVFIIMTIFHCCGQIAILCEVIYTHDGRVRHLKSDDNNETFQPHCNCLHCILQTHLSLIRLTRAIDDQVNFILFLRLILSMLQISIAGYVVSQRDYLTPATILVNIFYLGSLLSSCFVYCWIGEKLNEASDGIRSAAYNSNWFQYPRSTTTLGISLIIMQCTKHPMKMTAGKHLKMSLEFFKEYVTSAMSYLSVLISLKSGNK